MEAFYNIVVECSNGKLSRFRKEDDLSDHSKSEIDKYKKFLEERYQNLMKELEGINPVIPRENWHGTLEQYQSSFSYIDPIKLRLAADDFSNALKEVKKLK
ncbi:hypothetical protein [uncultured Desulfobacter sp.]|uniref:hypothetical protein n=1 Tax=uncultured Desulfobacter sp. TaxID=240139 RepID=UPI0029F4F724|nr:hypothetical protein [uncultured Desulfobacter sp.]